MFGGGGGALGRSDSVGGAVTGIPSPFGMECGYGSE